MFYKIGHRGAAGYAPENTPESFHKALGLDIDMIELDVYNCKSKELVVIHDSNTKRTHGKNLIIEKTEYQELKKIGIPSLEEVLNLIDKKVIVNIELKGKNTAQPTATIIKKYIRENGWPLENFLISSFDKKNLLKMQEIFPEIKKGVLIGNRNISSRLIKKMPIIFNWHLGFAKKIKAFSIHMPKNLTNEKIIRMAHKNNLKIFAYTVNQKKEINYLKSIGVDGIFSDYPNRL